MKHEITEIGREMLRLQRDLAEKHKYEPIQPNFFDGDVRDKYRENLPDWCKYDGDREVTLYTLDGTAFAHGYERVVVGDYGAFLEMSPRQMIRSVLMIRKGQEYRQKDPAYADHVKYLWLTVRDSSGIILYYQKKTVTYADYKPGLLYVSPYEVRLAE